MMKVGVKCAVNTWYYINHQAASNQEVDCGRLEQEHFVMVSSKYNQNYLLVAGCCFFSPIKTNQSLSWDKSLTEQVCARYGSYARHILVHITLKFICLKLFI